MSSHSKRPRRPALVPKTDRKADILPFRPPDTRRVDERPIEINVGLPDFLELLARSLRVQDDDPENEELEDPDA
jgi:hypothetical protein